ncbi:MAG: hypothetical protein R3B99_07750 [Polyangiales bacterium]
MNWGWGGRHDGWFDPTTLEDPAGRRWNRQAMIFRGLEPSVGYAAAMAPEPSEGVRHAWRAAARSSRSRRAHAPVTG